MSKNKENFAATPPNQNDLLAPFNINLFLSLCLFLIIPFFYQCVRTHLIVNIPDTNGLGIAGHIEWFDLINETIQAFLIVPLYHLFGDVKEDIGALKGRVHKSFVISTILYTCFAVFVLVFCSNITHFMVGETQSKVISYLRWETAAFIIGHISSFAVVVFVVIGKSSYINALTIGKTIMTVLSDLVLIPAFGVNGVAFSNIAVNLSVGLICLILVEYKEFKDVTATDGSNWTKQWLWIGSFSGAQILLDNIIYALIVCKMVNDVAEQGNYWVANNFIWSCLLVPIAALSEIIKRENSPKRFWMYGKISAGIAACWGVSISFWNPFFQHVMGIENPDTIFHIVLTLLPFYVAYAISAICSNLFTAAGKTEYNCIISAIVNIGYYGIMYGLYLHGVFSASMTFICYLFGGGMVVNAICGTVIFTYTELRHFTRKS